MLKKGFNSKRQNKIKSFKFMELLFAKLFYIFTASFLLFDNFSQCHPTKVKKNLHSLPHATEGLALSDEEYLIHDSEAIHSKIREDDKEMDNIKESEGSVHNRSEKYNNLLNTTNFDESFKPKLKDYVDWMTPKDEYAELQQRRQNLQSDQMMPIIDSTKRTTDFDNSFTRYNVAILMASNLNSPFDLERVGPAVDMALEEINEKFLAAHKVRLDKVRKGYPTCSGAEAPGLAADSHFVDNVIAFIGPACAFALEPVARLAAYWNTPIITGMGDQPPSEGELTVTSGILGKVHKNESAFKSMFKDKTKYPTLTRMSYCQCRLKFVFASVFNQFHWNHVALLLDRSDLFSLTVGKNLEYGLRKEGLLRFVRELNGNEEEHFESYLKDASMYARVVILSVRGSLVRRFMLAAHSLGMTNGEYAFLDVEIFPGSYWGEADWELGDENDEVAKSAYEALLRVSLLQPTSARFNEFAAKVKARAYIDYNHKFEEGEEVNFFIGAFYDGVYLLGMALNETLTEGENILDGVGITKRMWNREFSGITGHVRIDDNGDRDADYSILDLDPDSGKFEVVAHYYGRNRVYSPMPGRYIHWPGGRPYPPSDVPKCGFLGSDCHGNAFPQIVLTLAIHNNEAIL